MSKFGIQIRVIGDMALLPDAVRHSAEKVMEATAGNQKAILNVCLGYTYVNKHDLVPVDHLAT